MKPTLIQIFLLTICSLFLTSCYIIKLESISLPTDATEVKSTIDLGRNFVETDRTIVDYLRLNHYDDSENVIRKLENETDSAKIFEFYQKELTQKEFVKESKYLETKLAETQIWKKKNLLNEQIIIVSVIESRNNKTNEITAKGLLIYSAAK